MPMSMLTSGDPLKGVSNLAPGRARLGFGLAGPSFCASPPAAPATPIFEHTRPTADNPVVTDAITPPSPNEDTMASVPTTGALTPDQRAAIRKARQRRRSLDRAAGLAAFNGWSLILFAAASILLSRDPLSIALTVLFAFVGIRELYGRRLLKRLDPAAPKILGFNQILLAAIVLAYCLWSIITFLYIPHPGLQQALHKFVGSDAQIGQLPPEAQQLLSQTRQAVPYLIVGFYGLVALTSLITQGLMALYYFTRAAHLRSYLDDTPDWVIQMQLAMGR